MLLLIDVFAPQFVCMILMHQYFNMLVRRSKNATYFFLFIFFPTLSH